MKIIYHLFGRLFFFAIFAVSILNKFREIDNRYDSVTNYNDRAKFTKDEPMTGRQLRTLRRKIKRKTNS